MSFEAAAGGIDDDFAGHGVFFHGADAVDGAVQTGDGGDGEIGVELARDDFAQDELHVVERRTAGADEIGLLVNISVEIDFGGFIGRDAGEDIDDRAGRGVIDSLGDERGNRGHEDDVIEFFGGLFSGWIVGTQAKFVFAGERFGQFLQDGQAVIAQIAGENGDSGNALAEVADDVHGAHRAGGADDVDFIIGTDFRGGRDGGQRTGGVGVGGADDADAAIVDAANLRNDGTAKFAAVLHDVEQAAHRDFGKKLLDGGGVRAEINHVVVGGVFGGRRFFPAW